MRLWQYLIYPFRLLADNAVTLLCPLLPASLVSFFITPGYDLSNPIFYEVTGYLYLVFTSCSTIFLGIELPKLPESKKKLPKSFPKTPKEMPYPVLKEEEDEVKISEIITNEQNELPFYQWDELCQRFEEYGLKIKTRHGDHPDLVMYLLCLAKEHKYGDQGFLLRILNLYRNLLAELQSRPENVINQNRDKIETTLKDLSDKIREHYTQYQQFDQINFNATLSAIQQFIKSRQI